MGEYVLANPFRAATMRIDELANAVDASIATANRFARALGFDGYPALRAALVLFPFRSRAHPAEPCGVRRRVVSIDAPLEALRRQPESARSGRRAGSHDRRELQQGRLRG
ncbi:MurR/RpiR family transcriptional regulator, partial [Burkholderia pseudomallei]